MNHEPTGARTVHCAVCREPASITNPLPLCGTCSLRVIAAYAAANLRSSNGVASNRQRDVQAEVKTIYELLDAEGWNAVDLRRTMQVLNRPKATAAKRLVAARKQYAADLNRRTSTKPTPLNGIEQQAVDRLRSTGRPVNKRSIAEVVRRELRQSIASDRAAEIARDHNDPA